MVKKRIRFSSRKNIKKIIKKKEEPEICFHDNGESSSHDDTSIDQSRQSLPDTIMEEEVAEPWNCKAILSGSQPEVAGPDISEKREVLPLQVNVPSTIQEQIDTVCLECQPPCDQDIEPSALCGVRPSVGEPSRALDLVKPNDLAPAEQEVSFTEKEKKTVSVIMLAPGTFAVPSKQFEEVKVIRIVEMDDRWANFSILIDVEQLDFQFINIINLQTNMPLSLICPIEHQQDLPFFNENILKSPFLLNSPKSKNKYIMRKAITSDMFIAWSDKRDPYKTYKISMIMKNDRVNSTMDNMMNYACIQLFNTMVFDFNISPFFFCTK